MSNHLLGQTSPYLLQHAENPVDWYPWGPEAFEKARAEDKPVFLSIGYSTCHWCHVMARESFENKAIAQALNQGFVSIKVDREERPDIDSLYMAACQAFTGSGGWPATLFLTPDQKPFFAGTYFPPHGRGGLPGLDSILSAVRLAWETRRETLTQPGDRFLSLLARTHPKPEEAPQGNLLLEGVQQWERTFDQDNGGFGGAPKFPMGHSLLFLLTYGARRKHAGALAMAEKTLTQLCRGGIYDHIGGGFCRYATDKFFRIPHFEKMLYDNALLMLAYCKAYQVTKKDLYRQVARDTAQYVLREMTLPSGGFLSAQDADSDGEEGLYYVFRPEEILAVLGEEKGRDFNHWYDITPQGNFRNFSLPNLLKSSMPGDQFSHARPLLYAYRKNRAALHRDDKVLAGWNGLMMAAMAWLYRVTGEAAYRQAAQRAWDYLERVHLRGDCLAPTSRDDLARGTGFLEDYAFCAFGLLALYEATLEARYLTQAKALCRKVLTDFSDPAGGFFLTDRQGEALLHRPKETADGALPSGNTMMAWVLLRLAQHTGEIFWKTAAQAQLRFLEPLAWAYPTAYPVYLLARLAEEEPPEEVTIVLAPGQAGPKQPWPFPLDALVKVLKGPTKDRPLLDGKTTYYVCQGRRCLPPRQAY